MSLGAHDLYRLAWRHLPGAPSWLGYGLAHLVGDAACLAHRVRGGQRGVGQLRRNLARLLPPGTSERALRRATRAAMRSYMRYFYETFSLSALSPAQLDARVRPVVDQDLTSDLARGSVVVALPHMGNWDLVGAWVSSHLAQVLTVAERLEPEDLFEQFLAFRQSLGMRIIGQARGEKVFDRLLQAAGQGRYVVALLADRDLSSSGVQVPLNGHPAHVAAGPAALADRLEAPLYYASVAYERLTGPRRRAAGGPWGVVLTVSKVPAPAGPPGRQRIEAWTRAWVEALTPVLLQAPTDWHMLQAVFDQDLDHERLARSRRRDHTPAQEER